MPGSVARSPVEPILPHPIGAGKTHCWEMRTEVERQRSPDHQDPGRLASHLCSWFTGPGGRSTGPASPGPELCPFAFLKFPQPQILLSSGLDLLPKHMEPIERICMLTL